MADHVYKIVELTGSSRTSVDDAIRVAVRRASESIRNLRWFEVTQVRGEIADGDVGRFQVTIKAGFTLEE